MVDLSSSEAASLVYLPNELLDVILLNCNTQSLYSLLLVCKRLYDPALKQLLYHIEFHAEPKSFQQQILLLRTILDDPSYAIHIKSLYLSEQNYSLKTLVDKNDETLQDSYYLTRSDALKYTISMSPFLLDTYYTVFKKNFSTTNLAFLQGWPATIDDVKVLGDDAYRYIDTSLLYHLDELVYLRIGTRGKLRFSSHDLYILCSSEFGRIRKPVLPELKCLHFDTDSSFLGAKFAFTLPQVQLIKGIVADHDTRISRCSESLPGISSKSFRKYKKKYSIITTELGMFSFPTSKLLLTNLTHIYIQLIDPLFFETLNVDSDFVDLFTESIHEYCKENLVVFSFLGRAVIHNYGDDADYYDDWISKMGLYDFKKLKKLTLSLDLFGPCYIFPIDMLVRNLMVMEVLHSNDSVSDINDLIWRNMDDDDYSSFQQWTIKDQENKWYQKQRNRYQPNLITNSVEDLHLSKMLPPNIELLSLQQNGVGHGFLDHILMHMNQDKSFLPHLKQIGFICWLPPINGVVKSLSDKGIKFCQHLPETNSKLCYYVKNTK